jgi:CDP-4-dehydro-6-deoxyglucose reductase
MADNKLTRPWHGIPREQIAWYPVIDADACIGCGTCVTSCGRDVYRFDFVARKAVVANPMNCMVACQTCANTCPSRAITFPAEEEILRLEDLVQVHHSVEDELLSRREQLEVDSGQPRGVLVALRIAEIVEVGQGTRIFTLVPQTENDRLCEFVPGQYLEISVPGSEFMSRAYSIANAPRADNSLELQVRRVEGGRLSEWAFTDAAPGEVLEARGPLGSFTMRSPAGRPLVFVARGTGFAPIRALLEQQVAMFPERSMLLFWGATSSDDFYELEQLWSWMGRAPNLRVTLVARRFDEDFAVPPGVAVATGRLSDALTASGLRLADYDSYLAGPRLTVTDCLVSLRRLGAGEEHLFADSMST